MQSIKSFWLFSFIVLSTLLFTSSQQQVDNSLLKKYLERVLDLGNNTSVEVSHSAPNYVQELYDLLTESADNGETKAKSVTEGPFTVQAICPAKIHDLYQSPQLRINFPLTKLWVKANAIARAELVLEVNRRALPSDRHTVKIFSQRDDYFLGAQQLDASAAGFGRQFLVFNLSRVVQEAVHQHFHLSDVANHLPTFNFGVRIEVIPETNPLPLDSHKTAHMFHLRSSGSSQPLLVLYSSLENGNVPSDDLQSSLAERRWRRRRKRATEAENMAAAATQEDDDDDSSNDCALHQWSVDLGTLFLQSLIMPRRVNVNFCAGTCPFPAFDVHWNATNNAIIRNSFLKTQPLDANQFPAVPNAACVARTYESVSFLFHEENNYVFRKLDHVVASSCMCA